MWQEKVTKRHNLLLKHNKSLQNNKYQLNLNNKYQFILLADQNSKMTEKYIKPAKKQKTIPVKYYLLKDLLGLLYYLLLLLLDIYHIHFSFLIY